MWIVLGILFFIGWLMAKLVWNVASWGVHFLLAFAIIALVVHFIRGHHRHKSATAVT